MIGRGSTDRQTQLGDKVNLMQTVVSTLLQSLIRQPATGRVWCLRGGLLVIYLWLVFYRRQAVCYR